MGRDLTVRGDQLRCLLARLETIRRYAGAEPQQRVALSATVARPAEVAGRYLQNAVVVAVEGGRTLQAELEPLPGLADLSAALARRSADKTLLFCNTRHEVEQTAVYLRSHLPFEAEIFVHYGNLDAGLRREVEARFAAASVAICVSSSTLELGIDIGSIDEVALLGPPPSVASAAAHRPGWAAGQRNLRPLLVPLAAGVAALRRPVAPRSRPGRKRHGRKRHG